MKQSMGPAFRTALARGGRSHPADGNFFKLQGFVAAAPRCGLPAPKWDAMPIIGTLSGVTTTQS